MLVYERVWLSRDLDDLVPFRSILTDQSDRDQLAAKAVELGIHKDVQGDHLCSPGGPALSGPNRADVWTTTNRRAQFAGEPRSTVSGHFRHTPFLPVPNGCSFTRAAS